MGDKKKKPIASDANPQRNLQRESGKKEGFSEKERNEYAKKQVIHHDKIFKKMSIGLAGIILIIVFGYIFINSARNFEYRGITGNAITEGDLLLYRTSLPVLHQGEVVPYNFYLRNDPRKLDKIPFNGEILLLKNMVLSAEEGLQCNGDGVISVANLAKLYGILGTKVIKDENVTCDPEGKYLYLDLVKAVENSIEQFGPGCYKLNIKDCDILKVTERFMVETFIKVQELI